MIASEIPISKTKIILPKRRVELLSRQRLLNALYEYLDRKLIMVSAPAGYGKTSLLIDLAYHSDLPFCWLALDELDRDLPVLIAYLIATLAERFPKFGKRSTSTLSGLTSMEEGMERLLVTLVNEIYDEIHEHFVLVLDDFHLLDEVEPIQYFINRFTQLVSENCHLILSSRSLPNLPDMPLLVAREQVGGLDFSDLSFRPEEIQDLLAQNQEIRLSDEEARELYEVTEGWITGLQFMDLNLARSGRANFQLSQVIGVSVFDYLGQQVLERQPEWLRALLLRSSLLEEFDANLCETVLAPLYPATQNWSSFVETIVQKNLFTLPVGTNGQWVRYHHLFRDYLQERFRQEYPAEVNPILRRLAQFHETQGRWEQAYQLYRQLGDMEALANMIERAGIFMTQHSLLTLESWIKELPPSLIQKRPHLISLRGNIETSKGNTSEAIVLFDRAVMKFRVERDIPGLLLALVRRGDTYRLLGDYQNAARDASEVMEALEANDELQWIYADALRVKGLSLYQQGQSLQAVRLLERALDTYVRVNDTHSIPILLMGTAMVYSAIGNYSEAKASYEKALAIWRTTGNLSWEANLLNNLGVLYHQQGEYELAVHTLEEGLLCAQRSGYKRFEAWILISLGDLYAEVEDFEIAAQNYRQVKDVVQLLGDQFLINYLTLAEVNLALLQKNLSRAHQILDEAAGSLQSTDSNYEHGLYELMRGRLLLLDGRVEEAIDELTASKECFTQDGREIERVWSHTWLAAAQYQAGEKTSAREEIRSALSDPNRIDHHAVIAARQARDMMDGLRHDHESARILRNLFERVDRLNDSLPRTRRQLRRLTHTIQVPPAQLVIKSFGRGQVSVNGRALTMTEWQTQSVRELFFYLLSVNRPMTKEKISEVLWPETTEPAKLRIRFKNEMYRLRHAVGQNAIRFEDEHYRFNPGIDHEYDVEAFEAYLARAKSAATSDEQVSLYQKAIELVRGPYLEDIGSTWILPEREHLSQEFLSACLVLAELYLKGGQTLKSLATCQRALEYDPTSEATYRLMMEVYHRMGDRASVVHTYQACEQTMHRTFSLPPSEETQKLYHQFIS
jgi:ATP/maltotriose-dependent transcriptional regulator MalT/two-component SAPR family response regulator